MSPRPNVALVLQYLQALRVSSGTFTKEKKYFKKFFIFFNFLKIIWIPDFGFLTHNRNPTNINLNMASKLVLDNQDFRIEFR